MHLIVVESYEPVINSRVMIKAVAVFLYSEIDVLFCKRHLLDNKSEFIFILKMTHLVIVLSE